MSLLTGSNQGTKPVPSKWARLSIWIAVAVVALAVFVVVAKWARGLQPVQEFLVTYPGRSELPAVTSVGLPPGSVGNIS